MQKLWPLDGKKRHSCTCIHTLQSSMKQENKAFTWIWIIIIVLPKLALMFLRINAKQICLKIKIPTKYHITWTQQPTYGPNKAVQNTPSNLNELDICMPVLALCPPTVVLLHTKFPTAASLPLPSAEEEEYRCFYFPFFPSDSYSTSFKRITALLGMGVN